MIDRDALRDLLAASSGGDRAAFAQVFQAAGPRLYGIALRILRRPDLATEALRRHFARLWAEAAAFAEEADLVAAMAADVRAAALDLARAQPEGVFALEPFEVEEDLEDPLESAPHSPDLHGLLTCLGQLSEERRRMVLHAYYDGWSREALSVYFDAPIHAVNTWMWRSIGELDAGLRP
ncbi:sigma factor-like helix-turn-helix DNA-binding protein [Aquabacter spiritensis]|uniref:RNA polymerase sigma-70 factor (ECF subfamily) n=1 Tax=Aquabacter spiritensis TaxID=933073 RepID=A0A4R3LPU3_9HYPH|nr:sigma factor-like helix-turn-helix DNA-binding protein [Aquabacter spiritensis]TCT00525.1 RNA polymerase sigma-70 factor (ECF subfamily) [Aquabacter spiritensis]